MQKNLENQLQSKSLASLWMFEICLKPLFAAELLLKLCILNARYTMQLGLKKFV